MTLKREVKILTLAGSYRHGSFNQALLAAARQEAPDHVEFSNFDLREVPFYDADDEEAGPPPAVERLNSAVRDADALLLATPEYNSGIPAVLKNGIDWASRGYPNAPIAGRIVALMGASPGRSGTRFAQQQLRQVVARTGAVLLDEPQVMVARAGDLIVDQRVTDEALRTEIRTLVEALAASVELCIDSGSQSTIV